MTVQIAPMPSEVDLWDCEPRVIHRIEHDLVDAFWDADAKAFYRLTTELAESGGTAFSVKTWWRIWRRHDHWIWD